MYIFNSKVLVFKKWCFSLLFFLLFFLPSVTKAVVVYPETSGGQFAAEDKKIINIYVNTEGETINALEGLVGIFSPDGPIYVHELSVGGSDFSLWPSRPSLTPNNGSASISFVGGVQNGINKKDALLFSVAVTAEKAGNLFIVPVSLVAYANDGKGTPLKVSGSELKLTVTSPETIPTDEWQDLVNKDDQPPAPFSINMGRDSSVFEGKWFISFNTTDAGSGIDYYEVSEGERAPVRSGTTYVLLNQDRKVPITVSAFDKAGNVRSAHWSPFFHSVVLFDKIVIGAALLFLGVFFYLVIKKWRKRKK